jgi:cell division protein FtsB
LSLVAFYGIILAQVFFMVQKKDKDWRGKIWTSNFFTIFLLLLLVISLVRVSREVVLRYNINKEIRNLNEQLQSLEEKTAKTDKLIAYLETDQYIEKEARLQLNLSKPGEKQINLTGEGQGEVRAEEEVVSSNLIKWFNYFFK